MAKMRDSRKLKSYFWLYAPVPDIQLTDGSYIEAVTENHPSFTMDGIAKISDKDRHLTVIEQDKPRVYNSIFPGQPIDSERQIDDIIQTIKVEFLGNDGPLTLCGEGLSVLSSRYLTHLSLAFNRRSLAEFADFHDSLKRSLSNHRFADFWGERIPHIRLASISMKTDWMKAADPESYKERMEDRFRSLTTKPLKLNALVLGQSFYSTEGYRVKGSDRPVAVIHSNGKVDRLCVDPFNKTESDDYINGPVKRERAARRTKKTGRPLAVA